MLLLIVICVIVGLWLWEKEAKTSEGSLDGTGIDENYCSEGDDIEEVAQEETVTQDNALKVDYTYDIDEILKLKNKDFVFRCLYILSEKNKKDDIEKLTNADFCKNNFNMYYPILQEVDFDMNDEKIFLDNCGYRRYYPDIITLFDKKYIVCNDWFYNNKSNPRDTRTPFVKWVVR